MSLSFMRKIVPWLKDSAYLTPLSPACKMCAQGAKLVLLITGVCDTNCFYCPISFKKGGTDRIFADEWELHNEHDTETLLREAQYIDAKGAGITGGDPLLVWKRVQTYIGLLKDTFGSSFHIHLYTSGLQNTGHIPDIIAAGLDEIRFHPMPQVWDRMEKTPVAQTIKKTVNQNIDVAIEIPVVPGKEQQILSLIKWTATAGVRWINLNELEFSERNNDAFILKGYEVKEDLSAAVKGSEETAISVLKSMTEMDLNIGVHYCSVSFKDGVQLRNRIKRRANHVAKEYDVISEDGTFIKGVIYASTEHLLETLLAELKTTYHVPSKYLFFDKEKKRIEIGLWILEDLAEKLKKQGYSCYMIEEYPTADRLEVERSPLPL